MSQVRLLPKASLQSQSCITNHQVELARTDHAPSLCKTASSTSTRIVCSAESDLMLCTLLQDWGRHLIQIAVLVEGHRIVRIIAPTPVCPICQAEIGRRLGQLGDPRTKFPPDQAWGCRGDVCIEIWSLQKKAVRLREPQLG